MCSAPSTIHSQIQCVKRDCISSAYFLPPFHRTPCFLISILILGSSSPDPSRRSHLNHSHLFPLPSTQWHSHRLPPAAAVAALSYTCNVVCYLKQILDAVNALQACRPGKDGNFYYFLFLHFLFVFTKMSTIFAQIFKPFRLHILIHFHRKTVQFAIKAPSSIIVSPLFPPCHFSQKKTQKQIHTFIFLSLGMYATVPGNFRPPPFPFFG